MHTFGPPNFLVCRGCPLSELKLYHHGPVGTTELERFNLEGPLREITLYGKMFKG